MSSGQRPRTPEHFPRMKVRGHHRRFRRMLISGEFDAVIQQTVDRMNELLLHINGLPPLDFSGIFPSRRPRKEERSNAT
ncbi:hypothetical protein [Rhodococcoides fascians]|uniref:hypothetical protein n=1 Tax=Rhodococcoides fascians TaxID=1828 RepID=UPI001140582F|nr:MULTISPECIES: hypothetical protein [Rhodococcus]